MTKRNSVKKKCQEARKVRQWNEVRCQKPGQKEKGVCRDGRRKIYMKADKNERKGISGEKAERKGR